MISLHTNQKSILDFLLAKPEGATLDELAENLGVTKTAAKEHLLRVEHLGYISFEDSRGSVGRPRRRYTLSVSGQEAFPRQYSWLSTLVLELLAEDIGQKGLTALMGKLADKVSAGLAPQFEKAGTSKEALELLVKTMNELGYRAALKQSDLRKGAIIEATNCVYHSVAKAHPELCSFDIRLMENTTGLKAKLETCIARGGSVCRFCLRTT